MYNVKIEILPANGSRVGNQPKWDLNCLAEDITKLYQIDKDSLPTFESPIFEKEFKAKNYIHLTTVYDVMYFNQFISQRR